MEPALLMVIVVAILAAVILFVLLLGTRSEARVAKADAADLRKRLEALEADSRRTTEALDGKRREAEEAKERLRDVKKRRHEEKEASRLKKDIEHAREEIEREMERKLAVAREETAGAKSALKKLTAEVEALRARRPAPVEAAASTPPPAAVPATPREVRPEELARLELAERALVRAKQQLDEYEAESRRARGRAETERRVALVQKGELDIFRDKFRTLEGRHNALVLERDELHRRLFTLERQLQQIQPVAEPTPAPLPAPVAAATPAAVGSSGAALDARSEIEPAPGSEGGPQA